MLASNANQAFTDTQYMINQRELRWMDQIPPDKRHYKYLQEAQQELEKRKKLIREGNKNK